METKEEEGASIIVDDTRVRFASLRSRTDDKYGSRAFSWQPTNTVIRQPACESRTAIRLIRSWFPFCANLTPCCLTGSRSTRILGTCQRDFAARIKATMPDLLSAGSVGQASTRAVRSGVDMPGAYVKFAGFCAACAIDVQIPREFRRGFEFIVAQWKSTLPRRALPSLRPRSQLS
jgi:hypothetical protein